MTKKAERLFVVVDPSHKHHVALERALRTAAKFHEVKPLLKIFIAVDSDAVDTRATNDSMFRDQTWFEAEIRAPIEEVGLEYSVEISWSGEWQQSIVMSAKAFSAERIYLPVHERTNTSRFSFSESKWDLLKTAECPVVLIQPHAPAHRKVVLAAVNFQATGEAQVALNESILVWAKHVAGIYSADLHVVNAYFDSMHYPDRGRLANSASLPQENIHVRNGYTDEVVATVAEEINADLVVMGTLGQNGSTKSRRGNTAARVIAALMTDIMVINY